MIGGIGKISVKIFSSANNLIFKNKTKDEKPTLQYNLNYL